MNQNLIDFLYWYGANSLSFNRNKDVSSKYFLLKIKRSHGVVESPLVPLGLILGLSLLEVGRGKPCLRVGVQGSSEQQDKWLWLVHFVVHPSSWLGHAEAPPLVLRQELTSHVFDLLVNFLRQEHVSILVEVIGVLFRILDLVWKMRHFKIF